MFPLFHDPHRYSILMSQRWVRKYVSCILPTGALTKWIRDNLFSAGKSLDRTVQRATRDLSVVVWMVENAVFANHHGRQGVQFLITMQLTTVGKHRNPAGFLQWSMRPSGMEEQPCGGSMSDAELSILRNITFEKRWYFVVEIHGIWRFAPFRIQLRPNAKLLYYCGKLICENNCRIGYIVSAKAGLFKPTLAHTLPERRQIRWLEGVAMNS